jgi:hypothetical protein
MGNTEKKSVNFRAPDSTPKKLAERLAISAVVDLG